MLNENIVRLFSLKICISNGCNVRQLMKEFPATTWNWKKIALNFLNQLKETGNSNRRWQGEMVTNPYSAKQRLRKFPTIRRCLRFPRQLTSRIAVFIPTWSHVMRHCTWTLFWHMANVNRAEYFMADAYARVAMLMASAGTLVRI